MKYFLITAVFLLGFNLSYSKDKINLSPTHSISLKITGEGGTNSGAVAYNPVLNVYYAIISGNEEFPLEVFRENGELLKQLRAAFDIRGLWYNDVFKTIEGNVYDTHTIIEYLISDDSSVYDPAEIIWDMSISEPNTVLDYNSKDSIYIAYDDYTESIVEFNSEMGTLQKELIIKLPVDKGDINITSVIYTGIEEAEYGLLDFKLKRVYLFNKENGKNTKTIQLPDDSPVSEIFNFSFANDYIWLFDKEAREWKGFNIVK